MPEPQAPLADRIGRALVPMVEMFKALPPQAGDDCQVQVVILRRDLRLAHEAGLSIVHESTMTEAGSILVDKDRLDQEDKDRLLKTLLASPDDAQITDLAEKSGLDVAQINTIIESLKNEA